MTHNAAVKYMENHGMHTAAVKFMEKHGTHTAAVKYMEKHESHSAGEYLKYKVLKYIEVLCICISNTFKFMYLHFKYIQTYVLCICISNTFPSIFHLEY